MSSKGKAPAWAQIRKRVTTEDLGELEQRDPETGETWKYQAIAAHATGTDGQEHAIAVHFAPGHLPQGLEKSSRLAMIALANQMHEQGVWAVPIDTTNRFGVGTNGDRISAMAYAPGARLTKDEALTFAAWLVMCADYGELDRFNEIFEVIRDL